MSSDALLHGSTAVVGIETNSWAARSAAESLRKNRKYTFTGEQLKVIVAALEGWRTMIDDEPTPYEDALIEVIHAELYGK